MEHVVYWYYDPGLWTRDNYGAAFVSSVEAAHGLMHTLKTFDPVKYQHVQFISRERLEAQIENYRATLDDRQNGEHILWHAMKGETQ